ncbi:MAG: RNA pyrophosphohydrolase [Gammaproteobacteria bacterium]|nr:RNA pyrophosphohydrolase [Gammaproteobacteria bacterium]MCP5195954.1 RNA pyrophosphohydrolase [Gammaproteobacteria bacterium]
MIDSEGYRPNVGIILCNAEGRLFWGRRIGQHSWQFPQGGIRRDESPEQAMFRELAEEVGLRPEHVQVIGATRGWLRYRLPKRLVRQGCRPSCIGQKQIWFLLRMRCDEDVVRLDLSEHPEFDLWQWVDYWYPLRAVVAFKRHVYWRALHELAPFLSMASSPTRSATTRRIESVLRNPEERPIWPSPIRSRTLESPRLSTGIQQVTVLQMRQVENSQNPVITRMVVATRRLSTLEKTATTLALDLPDATALDEGREARPPRTVATSPR